VRGEFKARQGEHPIVGALRAEYGQTRKRPGIRVNDLRDGDLEATTNDPVLQFRVILSQDGPVG
jgi:hypothetical protein